VPLSSFARARESKKAALEPLLSRDDERRRERGTKCEFSTDEGRAGGGTDREHCFDEGG